MNQKTVKEPRKVLVRNTSRSVPKTVVIKSTSEKPSSSSLIATTSTSRSKSQESGPKFESADLNSALNIIKKVNAIENLKPAKTTRSLPVLALDEKVTKRVNFPYDQSIYKDLIPLEGPSRSCPIQTTREPLPLKDKEPILTDFISDRQVKDYLYQPRMKLDDKTLNVGNSSDSSNLRIYKVLNNYYN